MNIYRKTYFCVCEGKQEKLYVEKLGRLLKIFPERVITSRCVIDNVKRLKNNNYIEYDSALIFDNDFKSKEFENNIRTCNNLNRNEQCKNIYHAYSNLNFDLWLILHKEYFDKQICKNDSYIDKVRKLYYLDAFDDIKTAIKYADKIRSKKHPPVKLGVFHMRA